MKNIKVKTQKPIFLFTFDIVCFLLDLVIERRVVCLKLFG
jgi:hypothetical protein